MKTISCYTLMLLALCVPNANAVIHYTLETSKEFIEGSLESIEAVFGPGVAPLGYTGKLIVASPLNESCTTCLDYACQPLKLAPMEMSIALVQRSPHFDGHERTDVSCTFEWKVRNAMNAGYGSVIIYNYPGDQDLEAMQSDGNDTDINISSVFIGGSDGLFLQKKIQDTKLQCIVTLYPDPAFHSFLITFVIVIASSSIVFTIFLFYRRHMIMSRVVQIKKMSKREVMKLPKRSFKPADAEETCVICIENFARGDTITHLPCKHIFHKKCIIPWLSEQQRVCPICKRDPLEPISETTPLIAEEGTATSVVPTPPTDTTLTLTTVAGEHDCDSEDEIEKTESAQTALTIN